MKHVNHQALWVKEPFFAKTSRTGKSGKGAVMEAPRQSLIRFVLNHSARVAAILCLLLTVGAGNAWGVVVTDTIPIVQFNSTSGTSYTSSTGTTNKGVGASIGNFIPNSGQIRVNQGSTSTTNASNFYAYNTEAMPGYITKVELVISSGSTTASYCRLGTSTSSAVSSNVAFNSSTASSLSSSVHSWTLNESDKVKYFRINWAKNGGTVKASYVIITYVYHTVTYNGNGNTGGTAPTDDTKYLYDAYVTTKANSGSLSKGSSYTFSGWNTKADGTGTTFAVSTSDAFKITQDTTLYAKWEASCTNLGSINGSYKRTQI